MLPKIFFKNRRSQIPDPTTDYEIFLVGVIPYYVIADKWKKKSVIKKVEKNLGKRLLKSRHYQNRFSEKRLNTPVE